MTVGVLAGLLVLTGCGSGTPSDDHQHDELATVSEQAGRFQGLELPIPIPRPSFTLADESGAAYDFADRTAGIPTLLFFGFTHCPDICPTTMADVATAIRALPPDLAETVRVVFVTTDPARDTGPVLAEYLANFDADLPSEFIGLTGTLEQVEAAQRAAKVTVAEDDGQQHSAQLQLYGPDDLARVVFIAGNSPEEIVHDLPLIAGG